MLTLIIPDMTCAHCVKTISNGLAAIDANAKLAFDLPKHRLDIETAADRTTVVDAIERVGYKVDEGTLELETMVSCCAARG